MNVSNRQINVKIVLNNKMCTKLWLKSRRRAPPSGQINSLILFKWTNEMCPLFSSSVCMLPYSLKAHRWPKSHQTLSAHLKESGCCLRVCIYHCHCLYVFYSVALFSDGGALCSACLFFHPGSMQKGQHPPQGHYEVYGFHLRLCKMLFLYLDAEARQVNIWYFGPAHEQVLFHGS